MNCSDCRLLPPLIKAFLLAAAERPRIQSSGLTVRPLVQFGAVIVIAFARFQILARAQL